MARAISKIEDGSDGAAALMKEIYQHARAADCYRNHRRAGCGQVVTRR